MKVTNNEQEIKETRNQIADLEDELVSIKHRELQINKILKDLRLKLKKLFRIRIN